MTENNNGGPAFPFPHRTLADPYDAGMTEKLRDANLGMSLRDWFAGMALQGMSGCHYAWQAACKGQSADEFLSKCAYELADAMLKARGE